ncbi:MAG: DNA internalization-related competence protein ComEC/Rec2, partial [Myxococcota bacterium]
MSGIACAWTAGIVFGELGILPVPALLLIGVAALAAGIGVPALRSHAVLWTAVAGGALSLSVAAERDRLPRRPVESTLVGHVSGGGERAGLAWIDLEGVAGAGLVRLPERLQLAEVVDEQGAAAAIPGFAAVPGQRLRARALLRAPQPARNPGKPDFEAPLRRSGRADRAWLVAPQLLVAQGFPEVGARQIALRLRAGRLAALSGEGDARALLRALGLGERSSLSEETRRQFRSLGIGHLLAVSGLHLALVAGLAYRVLARLLRGSAVLAARVDTRRCALFGCVLVAGAYALLTGYALPVRRAWIFLAVGAGAALLVRPGRPAGRLAAAALAVLVAEPAALFEPGAQLSFAAAAALVGGADAGARDGKRSLLWSSATATAVTAPLAAWHFGSSAPAGMLVNLVAIPWTALVALPAALAALGISALPEGAASAFGLSLCEFLAGLSLSGVRGLAAHLPEARETPLAEVWVLAAGALGIATACTKRMRQRVLGALAVSALLALSPPQRFEPEPPRAVVLDVGQGDAVLVQGSRAALLVDAGGALGERWDRGERDVLPALAALGVGRLDLVVASHGDLDHRGGLPAVLRGIEVGRVWLPLGHGGAPDFDAIRAVARQRGVPVEERGAGSPALDLGDLRVSPLWPPMGYEAASRNDASLVIRVERGPRSVLLPGDLEARGEAALLASGASLA